MANRTIGVFLIGSIYLILPDELIIGSAQRRIGPFNLGWYGILPSIINGLLLIDSSLLFINPIDTIDFTWLFFIISSLFNLHYPLHQFYLHQLLYQLYHIVQLW